MTTIAKYTTERVATIVDIPVWKLRDYKEYRYLTETGRIKRAFSRINDTNQWMDITELAKAQEQLQKLEKQFRDKEDKLNEGTSANS